MKAAPGPIARWTSASNRLAHALAARGISHGDAVALLLRNAPEFPIADIAIAKLGAVRVPLNEMLAARDVAYMLGHSGARAAIVHSSFADLVAAERAAFDAVSVRLCVRDGEAPPLESFTPYDEAVDAAPAGPVARPPLRADDPALIIYTGGTTGRPKGVLHAQGGLGVNVLAQAMYADIAADDHLLLCTPLPHSAHLLAEAAWLAGAHSTLARGFDPVDVLDRVEGDGVTWLFLVPTMIYRLLDAPGRAGRDLAGLRTILYGAAPITTARLREALDAFGPVLVQLYGQTEVPNFVTQLSKTDHLDPANEGSCGRPTVFCDVAILGADGAHLAPGEAGEVAVRSAYTLARYHDDPEQTAAAFRGEWLLTGDVGYEGANGCLFLVDRAKDMIISGGMNVYSTEVENVLEEHAAVAQATVIGLPDDDWGESVTALVVPADADGDLDAAALVAFCKSAPRPLQGAQTHRGDRSGTAHRLRQARQEGPPGEVRSIDWAVRRRFPDAGAAPAPRRDPLRVRATQTSRRWIERSFGPGLRRESRKRLRTLGLLGSAGAGTSAGTGPEEANG